MSRQRLTYARQMNEVKLIINCEVRCPVALTVVNILHVTHCVDATELQCDKGNGDGEELPADCLVS